MTTTGTIGNLTSAASLQKTKTTGTQEIGQEGYLKLLTAQLQYQDPTEPTDNSQLVTQLATIQQSKGIAEMNSSLADIRDSLSGSRLSDAASWIGKSMLVRSTTAAPDSAGQYGGELTLDDDARAVSVDLIDGNGRVVKTLDLGAQSKGAVGFFWDGKDADGRSVDAGALRVQVRGARATQVATWATVAAVQSPASGGSAKLITPIGSFAASDALRLA
jgi:flagellar basal-body rod modification protein FlgD